MKYEWVYFIHYWLILVVDKFRVGLEIRSKFQDMVWCAGTILVKRRLDVTRSSLEERQMNLGHFTNLSCFTARPAVLFNTLKVSPIVMWNDTLAKIFAKPTVDEGDWRACLDMHSSLIFPLPEKDISLF